MKPATLKQVKDELQQYSREDLLAVCLRLARFRVENKELLTYLLFGAQDELAYIDSVKKMIDEEFAAMNRNTDYYIKKTVRKILKLTRKYIKYSGKKTTEIDLMIYFCRKMISENLPFSRSKVLENTFRRERSRVYKLYNDLHEDFQLDYEEQVQCLKSCLIG